MIEDEAIVVEDENREGQNNQPSKTGKDQGQETTQKKADARNSKKADPKLTNLTEEENDPEMVVLDQEPDPDALGADDIVSPEKSHVAGI